MSFQESHREGMLAAAQTHHDLGINTTEQIDVFSAIDRLGLKLLFRPLDGCAGAYLFARSSAGVLINSRHPFALQRLTAAHELGHHVFEHGATFDRETYESISNRHPREEQLAQAFAAWFLMPPELVDQALMDLGLGQPQSEDDVYGLSLILGTSYLATCYHLVSLELADWNNVRQWAKVSPKSIKTGVMPSLAEARSDVWRVDITKELSPIRVKLGDYLILNKLQSSVELQWTSPSLRVPVLQTQAIDPGQQDLFPSSQVGAIAIRVPEDLLPGRWLLEAKLPDANSLTIFAVSVTGSHEEGLYLHSDDLVPAP